MRSGTALIIKGELIASEDVDGTLGLGLEPVPGIGRLRCLAWLFERAHTSTLKTCTWRPHGSRRT